MNGANIECTVMMMLNYTRFSGTSEMRSEYFRLRKQFESSDPIGPTPSLRGSLISYLHNSLIVLSCSKVGLRFY